ncbi:MAG TPA: hypothetical protein VJB99_00215 [Patescibacteria group bacterium]|nr:hypothetical protein [Patescibacteria group bacterium]
MPQTIKAFRTDFFQSFDNGDIAYEYGESRKSFAFRLITHFIRNASIVFELLKPSGSSEAAHPLNSRGIEVLKSMENQYRFWSSEQIQGIERLLVHYDGFNDASLLIALFATGKETDLSYIESLEEEYGQRLNNARLAVKVFRFSEFIRRAKIISKKIDSDGPSDQNGIEILFQTVREAKETAEDLSTINIDATHATGASSVPKIEKDGGILNISSSEFEYTGSGVYCGIFGCYREWSDHLFEFKIPMADSFPSIRIGSMSGLPTAMTNLLAEGCQLPEHVSGILKAVGGKFWFKNSFSEKKIPLWTLEVFKRLGMEVTIQKLSGGEREVVIFESNPPPIVVATICNCLDIDVGISRTEISRLRSQELKNFFMGCDKEE